MLRCGLLAALVASAAGALRGTAERLARPAAEAATATYSYGLPYAYEDEDATPPASDAVRDQARPRGGSYYYGTYAYYYQYSYATEKDRAPPVSAGSYYYDTYGYWYSNAEKDGAPPAAAGSYYYDYYYGFNGDADAAGKVAR